MLSAIEIPPTSAHKGTVIILHGLGASGDDFVPVARFLALPHLRWVLPAAPQRAVTINGGYVMPAWYDIRSLGREPDRENVAHIDAVAVELGALVDRELDRGVPVVLMGFSQGAAMTAHVGVRHPRALAGLVVLSGYAVVPERFAAETSAANARTPAFVGHGRQDPVVPFAGGEQIATMLRAGGRPVRFEAYPIAHEVSPREIGDVGGFLRERLPA